MEEPLSIPRRRLCSFLIASVTVGLFSCCGGLALFGDRPKNGIRVERLEADLNERLPDGSSWGQAAAWFASYGFQADLITDEAGRKIGLCDIIPNDSLLQTADIRIEVYFSPEGRLRRRVIYRFVYSL